MTALTRITVAAVAAVVLSAAMPGASSARDRSRAIVATTPKPTISISISLSRSSAAVGAPVVCRGRVSPWNATLAVEAQRLVAGRWTDVGGALVVRSKGTFALVVSSGDLTSAYFRVRSNSGKVISPKVRLGTFAKAYTMFDSGDATKGERTVALTFDDGPDPVNTPALLDVLAAHQVHATFFVEGQYALAYPALIKRMLTEGHHVENHSWDHPELPTLTNPEIISELQRTDDVIRFEGAHPRCIRPPYGENDVNLQQLIAGFHAATLLWDATPDDYTMPGTSVIVDRVMAALHPTSIILMHDGGGDRSQTVAAVDQLIPMIQSAGYQIRPIC